MAIQRYLGRGGLARFLGISESRTCQLDPPPDALVDGRPVWLPETAARVKVERETRRAEREARNGRKARHAEAIA